MTTKHQYAAAYRYGSGHAIPDWLHAAMSGHIVEQTLTGFRIITSVGDEPVTGSAGDWIIQKSDGELIRVDHHTFLNDWEPTAT